MNRPMQQRRDAVVTIDWEDGTSETKSGAEVYKLIFHSNNPILSANGTIFTSEFQGVIRTIETLVYRTLQDMQGMKKKASNAGNKAEEEFWDKRQLVKKINLNSLYGAIQIRL